MRGTLFEAALGAVVLLVAGGFLAIALSAAPSGAKADDRLLSAFFTDIGGMTVGTDVRTAGVKVGTVTGIRLDPARVQAEVSIAIDPSMTVYEDASLKVASEGLLGGSYLAFDPGSGIDEIADGGVIAYTQSVVSVQDLLSKAVQGVGGAE